MLNHPMAKVSVVLCTYNGAAFIEAQILSIVSQSYPLHEIIVADDGSTDETVPILKNLAAQCPLIKVYQNRETLGYNKNFEQALLLASGDVLAIADQDDVWHHQKVEIMMRQWKKDAPLIYCRSAHFEGEDAAHAQPNRLMHYFEGSDGRRLAVYNTVSGHAMLIRKELLRLALPFNKNVYYDWWLTVVAVSNGGVQFCPEVLVYQRLHAENASLPQGLSTATLHEKEKIMVLHNLEQFKKTPGLSAANQKFFETLHRLWQDAVQGKSRWQLFLFLMRYRKIIYSSKRRKVAFFSHVKRSLQYAYK